MLHLRLIVPGQLVDDVVDRLDATPGVVHLVRGAGTPVQAGCELVTCDVAREAVNEVVEWLQDHGVHRGGAIVAAPVDFAVSDHAEVAERTAPGEGGDALIWEELEARVRGESALTLSFLLFMSVAAVIAAVGILLDSDVLIIGAMIVGPDYGPLGGVCVGLVRRRRRNTLAALRTLAVGVTVAAAAAFVATLLFRLASIGPTYGLSDRQLTAFVSRPDGLGAVVAVLAGVVGMLSLTEDRSGALVGVLVSVTTIPAIGNIGAAMAYGEWDEVGGAALQLAINLVGLVAAGTVTLLVQARSTLGGARERRRHSAARNPPSAPL